MTEQLESTTEEILDAAAPVVHLAELVARVDRVLGEDLYWFPVRHHSPTIARLLARCIRERKPRLIFIEGPHEAQGMIEYLVDANTKPPVAIYSSFRDDAALQQLQCNDPTAQAPRRSVWYPVTSYSPEYVAMMVAKEIGARAVFMDLPHYAFDDEKQPMIDLDQIGRDSDFYHVLAQAAGRRTWDETWDSLFETPRPDESYEALRRDMALFCAAVRMTTRPQRIQTDGTLARERFMWQTIRQTLKEQKLQRRDAMVACGGFHIFLDREDAKDPPQIPTGTVSVTVSPYSYFRISELSGYGAGNRAPRFYELCYEHHCSGGAGHLQVVIDHVIDVIKQARKSGELLSAADAIAATQHALLLARMRGRAEPVLDDIHDALITCCCKGDVRTAATHLLEALDETNIGTKLGRVTDRLGRLPIVNDFYEQLAKLDLEEVAAREKLVSYTLDKRQPLDSARSAFLHRLVFLGVEIGGLQREAAPFGQSVFKELWRLRWSPKIEAALIEKNLHGDTIESASMTLLRENLGAASVEAGTAARQLVKAIDMDLPQLVAQADQACGHAIDHDDRFRSLADALSALMLLERYAAYRNLGKQRLADLIARCFDRACFAVPEVASVPQDQWDDVVAGLLALAEPVMQRDDLDKDLFAAHVERAAKISTMPFLRGAFLGILSEMRRIPAENIAKELSAYARGPVDQQIVAGDFLHGVLRVSRTAIMLGAKSLIASTDELLRVADRQTFLSMIPRLRAAFETLHERQRDGMAERVAELYGMKEGATLRKLSTSVGAAQLMAELDVEVARIMEEWLGKT